MTSWVWAPLPADPRGSRPHRSGTQCLDPGPSSTWGTFGLLPGSVSPSARGVGAGDHQALSAETWLAREPLAEGGVCVHTCVHVCASVCTAVPSPAPSGREEGIFGALGSAAVGLITGFQPRAGGHTLGRRGDQLRNPVIFQRLRASSKGGIQTFSPQAAEWTVVAPA